MKSYYEKKGVKHFNKEYKCEGRWIYIYINRKLNYKEFECIK